MIFVFELPQMKKKELQLYLEILVCILYVTEDIPMAVLNASLLIQGNELDSNAAVFSFAVSVFQLGRKSSVFSQVSDASYVYSALINFNFAGA
jgi:hypothetical protein